MHTIPATQKMSASAGNWACFEAIQKHIHTTVNKHLDSETLLTALGILVGRNQVEVSRAHGRGVGYFYIFRPIQERLPL